MLRVNKDTQHPAGLEIHAKLHKSIYIPTKNFVSGLDSHLFIQFCCELYCSQSQSPCILAQISWQECMRDLICRFSWDILTLLRYCWSIDLCSYYLKETCYHPPHGVWLWSTLFPSLLHTPPYHTPTYTTHNSSCLIPAAVLIPISNLFGFLGEGGSQGSQLILIIFSFWPTLLLTSKKPNPNTNLKALSHLAGPDRPYVHCHIQKCFTWWRNHQSCRKFTPHRNVFATNIALTRTHLADNNMT